MFELKNITKKYGDSYALRNVSMTINKGLYFIIGASGSGKTTLLKILSGMEQEYEGEAFYCGKEIKTLTKEEKSYYYNNVFGFIWQDFNLMEDWSALENVTMAQKLKNIQEKKTVQKVIQRLEISGLAASKTKNLSGGEKQRVAIARELLKNPQVILADEPTSALDEVAAKATMGILREIAKSKPVIIVTHDTSLIRPKDKVVQLDKGELIGIPQEDQIKGSKLDKSQAHKLSIGNAWTLAITNLRRKWGRWGVSVASICLAALLLLVAVSGMITNSSEAAFEDLFATYGQSILDINLVDSFTGGAATGGTEEAKPNAEVSQNIDGLYERYQEDERISQIVYVQAYDNIKVTLQGQEYEIVSTNTVPTVNELTAGHMPMGKGNEVVIPKSLLKIIGETKESVIGQTIQFKASIYNWSSGEPILKPVSVSAKIVGVVDTTVKSEFEGKMMEYSIDDSFFFSQKATEKMRNQAGVQDEKVDFCIRAKTPADMIAIKDELNAEGIVPIGRFELVEDLVRLNEQTTEQSGSAIIVISVFSFAAALGIALITAVSRKREYAIYQVSGYAVKHLLQINNWESVLTIFTGIILFLCLWPLTNKVTIALWQVNILEGKMLLTGSLLIVIMGVLYSAVTMVIICTTKLSTSLKTGER